MCTRVNDYKIYLLQLFMRFIILDLEFIKIK